MVQIWERCKPLQLIIPVNTDHAMFIWKSKKPDLSFSKTLSRYQNSKILLSVNVIALQNLYMYIMSLQVWHGFFFFALESLCLLGFVTCNIERTKTFAILEK